MKMKTALVGGSGALAIPAFALAGAGTALADTPSQPDWLGDGKAIVDGVLDKTGAGKHLPNLPAPAAPSEGALPTHIFRKENESGNNIIDGIKDFVAPSAPPKPGKVEDKEELRHIGVDELNQAQRNTAVNYIKDGNIEGISRMLKADPVSSAPSSLGAILPTEQEWRSVVSGEHSPFGNEDSAAVRSHEGVTEWQNSFMADPLGTLAQTIAIAGGWESVMADPGRAIHRAVASIAGEQVAGDVDLALKDYVLPILLEDVPIATLAALGVTFITSLLGGIAGSIYGATLGGLTGAALGAMNPLAPLVGLLSAIPGSLIGSLLTGIPGLIGASLIGLSSLLLGPLLGATGGSLIALAILATVVFGSWLLFLGATFLVSIGIAIVVYIATLVIAFFLTPLFLFSPLPFIFAFGGSIFVAILLPFLITATVALLTIGIPVIAFALLSIPVALLGGIIGGITGLIGSLIFSAIAVPLLTLLSAIPGAIAGGILGYLTGDLITRIISAIVGAPIGAIIGAMLGFLPGYIAGAIAGLPLASLVFTAILTLLINRRDNDPAARAFMRVSDMSNQSFWDSDLGRLLRNVNDRFWDSELGRAIKPFADAMNRFNAALHSNTNPDAARNGALLGALKGIMDGIGLGALLGFLAPHNLLGAIPGGLLGMILGGVTGAIGGKLASMLLGALAALGSMPLTFIPNLLAAATLWTLLNAPLLLAGLALTIIPPIALAVAATLVVTLAAFVFVLIPIWLLFYVPASAIVLVGFLINGLGVLTLFTPIGLPLFGLGLGIAGFGAGLSGFISTIFLVIPTFALLLINAAIIGIPVFLLTLPFFAFPGLLAGIPYLLGLPLLIPAAAGASILEGILIGAIVDNLAQFVTIPAGAILGALGGGALGAFIGWLLTALAGSLLAATIGAIYGAGSGAWKGTALGSLLGLNWPAAFATLGGGGAVPGAAPAPVRANTAKFDAISDRWEVPGVVGKSVLFGDSKSTEVHDISDVVLSYK